MFHATPGQLPETGTPVVAGVRLPPGVQIGSKRSDNDAPVAWVTTELVPADQLSILVRTLAAAFEQTGLWPVQVSGLNETSLKRPWLDGEFRGPDHRDITAESIFDGTWCPTDYDIDDDNPQFEGMAAAVTGPDPTADDLDVPEAAGLMLVPTDRPANVPKVIGWQGAGNYDLVGEPMATVLRSWEDRFGAVLVAMGFATMVLQVARRPETDDQLEKLTFEHYAFCPDNINQGFEWDDYLAGLDYVDSWAFWWD